MLEVNLEMNITIWNTLVYKKKWKKSYLQVCDYLLNLFDLYTITIIH